MATRPKAKARTSAKARTRTKARATKPQARAKPRARAKPKARAKPRAGTKAGTKAGSRVKPGARSRARATRTRSQIPVPSSGEAVVESVLPWSHLVTEGCRFARAGRSPRRYSIAIRGYDCGQVRVSAKVERLSSMEHHLVVSVVGSAPQDPARGIRRFHAAVPASASDLDWSFFRMLVNGYDVGNHQEADFDAYWDGLPGGEKCN